MCRCSVRQATRAEAGALGWRDDTRAPPLKPVPWRDKRNGRTVNVPEGIDPGWGHMPD